MIRPSLMLAGCLLLIVVPALAAAGALPELQVGVAGHAFDHLGSIGEQAEAAAASGTAYRETNVECFHPGYPNPTHKI